MCIILVFHAFPGWLMTRKRFFPQLREQEYRRWLYWALHDALGFLLSPAGMELPAHPSNALFNCSLRFTQKNNKAAPPLYWNSTVYYVLLLTTTGLTVRHLESYCLVKGCIINTPIHYPETEKSSWGSSLSLICCFPPQTSEPAYLYFP